MDTLRAASLTSDLILRGSRKKDAFVTALKQVYVRNHVSDRNKQVRWLFVMSCFRLIRNVLCMLKFKLEVDLPGDCIPMRTVSSD